jgi:hypothetical protein
MPTAEQARFAAQLNKISARYGRLEDTTAAEIQRAVRDFQQQITANIGTAGSGEAMRLRELDQNLQRYVDDFQRRAMIAIRNSKTGALDFGAASVTAPLRAAGIEGVFNAPSLSQLNTAVDYTADLIRQIGDSMRDQISAQLRAAIVGVKSPVEVMQRITYILGTENQAGRYVTRPDVARGISARAEAVARTELQRAFNLSSYAQQQRVAETVPGLMKSWMATADRRTRESHIRAHLEYHAHPIPVNQPFVLKDTRGTDELMYPGDPTADPRFTINCRCRPITVHPAIGVTKSSLDGRIAAEVKRREDMA